MSNSIDAGKRMSDIVNSQVYLHDFDEIVRSFMAFSLDDGSSDNTLYPSMSAARSHQRGDNRNYAYISLRSSPSGMPKKEAWHVLLWWRAAREIGGQAPDPDSIHANHMPVMPVTSEDWEAQLDRLMRASGRDLSYFTK